MAETPRTPQAGSPALSQATLERVRELKRRYPSTRSAVLPALWAVQDELGYLASSALAAVADELGLEPSEVEAVSSFYSMYFDHPPGRHHVQVCLNVPCGLRGADSLLAHLERYLSVEDGQTSADGTFMLEGTVECLGGCGGAPMMQVDRYSYENLTPEKAEAVLDHLRQPAPPGGEHA